MNYIEIIGKGFPGVQCHTFGDGTIYEEIVWIRGKPMPTKAELEAWYESDVINSQNKGENGSLIFGSEFYYAVSTSISSTTSTHPQTKLVLNTDILPIGTYRIGVSYGWNSNSTGASFVCRLLQDGDEIYNLHVQQPEDTGGSFGYTGTDQRHNNYRAIYTTYDTESEHEYILKYNSSNGGTIVSIWDAIIEIWRVI